MNGFDPIRDVNLEFLCRGSLTVLGIHDEEKISSSAFLKISETSRIPFGFDKRQEIRQRAAMSKIPKTKVDELESTLEPLEISGPMQKKILPWEKLLQMDLDLSNDRARDQVKRNPLIVVASLVSKLPNLGGLCRTCETFNAELLVVDNLAIKSDPQFLSTCVSAEKWMPMVEVRVAQLEQFLLDKKENGYTLVGIEQATDSVSLEEFKFPVKVVLLLGREREGIPPTLLPLMDSIIEIPQFGVIRSLNVHVSGSLIIWEYIKQMIA